MTETRMNRNYKDSLFRMIFREKKELLNLYNAVNCSDYTDLEAAVDQAVAVCIESNVLEEFRPDYEFEFVCRKITKTSSVPTSRPDSGK